MPPELEQKKIIQILKDRKVLTLAAVVIAVVLLLVLLAGFNSYRERQASLPCTDNEALLGRLGENLDSRDREAMIEATRIVSDEVKNIEDYRQDYNCVYPAVVTDIHFSEVTSARQHLDILKQLESEGQELSPVFTYVSNAEALEEKVIFLEGLMSPENDEDVGQGAGLPADTENGQ